MRARVIAAVGCAALASCRSSHQGQATHAAAPDAAALDASWSRGDAPRPETRGDAAIGCRAIAKDGDVRLRSERDAGPGEAVRLDSEIAADAWISLPAGTRLVAKDPRTTRETTFLGPGEARVCVERREESWLAAGTFESTPGAGETPGAEEWVDTALAVVRYGSAKLRIVVRAEKTTVTSAGGAAFIWVADDARVSARPGGPGANAGARSRDSAEQESWLRVSDGTVELRPSKPASAVARAVPRELGRALQAARRCSELAAQTETLARRILERPFGEGGAPLSGDEIGRQVTTRRLARAACAVAAVRTQSLPPSDRGDLLTALDQAHARWSSLPVAVAAPTSP